ncbi:MAG TPA: hypothetical protein VIR60_06540 [Gammaproteobacteria bacterium]
MPILLYIRSRYVIFCLWSMYEMDAYALSILAAVRLHCTGSRGNILAAAFFPRAFLADAECILHRENSAVALPGRIAYLDYMHCGTHRPETVACVQRGYGCRFLTD